MVQTVSSVAPYKHKEYAVALLNKANPCWRADSLLKKVKDEIKAADDKKDKSSRRKHLLAIETLSRVGAWWLFERWEPHIQGMSCQLLGFVEDDVFSSSTACPSGSFGFGFILAHGLSNLRLSGALLATCFLSSL